MCYGFFKPSEGGPYLFFEGEDKLVHLGLFGVAAVLQMVASSKEWKMRMGSGVAFTGLFAVFFAIGTEWIQQFIPTRSADYRDTIFDILGAGGGIMFFIIFQKRNQSLAK